MNVDDIVLLAYVDRTLSEDQSAEVERLMQSDSNIAQRVTLLEISNLDYRETFASQALAPVPATLVEKVGSLSQSALDKKTDAEPGRTGTYMRDGHEDPFARIGKKGLRRQWGWPSLVGAFGAGLIACAMALLVTGARPGDGKNGPVEPASVTVASSPTDVPRWIRAAAGYQQLFGRETLVDSQLTDISKTKTIEAIHSEDRLALRVPDLSLVGLDLKAVQRLRYHGAPLIQIVYLPRTGAPVALCVMKVQDEGGRSGSGPSPSPSRLTVEDMDVLTWRQAGLQYALIAEPGRANLMAIAERAGMKPAV